MNEQVLSVLLIVAFVVWIACIILFPVPTLAITVLFLVWVIYSLLSGLARMFQR